MTKYYSGEVIKVNVNGTYDIKFEDGERKVMSKNLKSKKIMEEEMVRWKEKITIINITTTINTTSSSSSSSQASSQTQASSSPQVGDRVEAKLDGWTKYYAGEIIRVNNDETFDLKFDDGELKSRVKKSQLNVSIIITINIIVTVMIRQRIVKSRKNLPLQTMSMSELKQNVLDG